MQERLYRISEKAREYWETWEPNPGTFMVHWGEAGTIGETKTVKSTSWVNTRDIVRREMADMVAQGFVSVDLDHHDSLIVEYPVDGMGEEADVEKRHRLQDRLSAVLGRTGLGICDGGSIGSGTMEAYCFVIDGELARRVVEISLIDTEFQDYSRLYSEEADPDIGEDD